MKRRAFAVLLLMGFVLASLHFCGWERAVGYSGGDAAKEVTAFMAWNLIEPSAREWSQELMFGEVRVPTQSCEGKGRCPGIDGRAPRWAFVVCEGGGLSCASFVIDLEMHPDGSVLAQDTHRVDMVMADFESWIIDSDQAMLIANAAGLGQWLAGHTIDEFSIVLVVTRYSGAVWRVYARQGLEHIEVILSATDGSIVASYQWEECSVCEPD